MKRILNWAAAMVCVSGVVLQAKPLEIWISSFQDKVYYEEVVRLYQKTVDKDFEANIHAYGFREMPDKLAVAIKTQADPPDIVQLDEVLFGTYLSGEVPFVELSSRIQDAGLDKDILPQRLPLFGRKGKIYGVPQSLSAMVLYYRKDLFEELQITPEDMATWDSFVYQGKRLHAKGQATIALDPTYFEILLRQRGSDLFDEDGKLFPDEKLAIETLTWMRDLNTDGIGVLPDRASIFDPVFFNSAVSSGEIISIIGADWYGLDMLQQFTPELKGKWGVMPLPAWVRKDGTLSARTSTFAGQGLLLYKGGAQVDKSWDFVKFVMTDKEANVRRFVGGNSFPAYMPVWKDERMLRENEFFGNQRFGKIFADLASDLPKVVMDPRRPAAVFLFQESFFSSLMYGQITPEELIKQMRSALEQTPAN
jgi:ABC-type glycerol-3-phosphate transport system substrate-binding protein